MKLLILGHARHGKDTVAEMLQDLYGITFKSSSMAAAEIFIYDALKDKYGYNTFEDCYNDRTNRRKEWHDLICDYNKDDKAMLAKAILKTNDCYVGMRSDAEINECKAQGLFDLIIGVYNPNKPLEPAESFDIDLWQQCDLVIPNSGTKDDLLKRIWTLGSMFQ